jgi:hypothetical protein
MSARSAAANGWGGSIVFGIEKNEITARGLEGIDPMQHVTCLPG